MNLPDPTPVIDLIEAFRKSKAMFAAVALGIFDRLAEGPADVATLARGCDADALERLLDACVGLSLIEKQNGSYANTALASTYLARSSPRWLGGYILYSNSALIPLWMHLEDAVREGTHRWSQTFGFDGPLFSHFFTTPQAMRDFLMGMHSFGLVSSPVVARAFDLGGFRRLVDLGGATGHLALAVREAYPNLQVTLFDLPPVIDFARTVVPPCAIDLLPGDFFQDPLPEADLFAVGRILHDWSEEKIRLLLGKIHARLPQGGALLIAERLLDEDKSGPLSAQLQSLNMLVCTEGKERTLSEYTSLLKEAGFCEIEGRRTGTPLDAVLARKR